MENDSAHVIGAIELFILRHGRPPANFEQIRGVTEAIAAPDKIDPLLRFSWTISKEFIDKDEDNRKKVKITITVASPDHPTVVESVDTDLKDIGPGDIPKSVKY